MSTQTDSLTVLAQEFDIMRQEFEKLASEQLASPSSDIVDQYFTQLSVLSETAAMLNLQGMQGCLEKGAENLMMIDPEADFDSQLPGFNKWLDLAAQHLAAPNEEQPCIDWVNFLENEQWPSPLEVRESRQLINAFAEEIQSNSDESVPSDTYDLDALTTQLSSDADPSVIDAFLFDTPIQLENLFNEIHQLSFQCINVHSLITLQAAQRISHTIKGSANLVGLTALAWLAHELEDFFESLTEFCQSDQENEWEFAQPVSDLVLETLDCMMTLLDDAQNKRPSTLDYSTTLIALSNWSEWEKTVKPISQVNKEDIAERTENQSSENEKPTKLSSFNEDDQQMWIKLVEEMSINLAQSQELFKHVSQSLQDLKKHDLKIQEHRFELESAVDSRSMAQITQNNIPDEFDSLEMDRYDDIHRTTHQFIESISDNREMVLTLQNQITNFDGLIRQQRRHTEQFQHQVMQTSQQAFSAISSRLQRCVRQAARFTDKNVTLFLAGDDIRADRKIIQALADPLMHVLRNCVDHGIESDRRDKPAQGRIEVTYQIVQRHIHINITDDGNGIDAQALLLAAEEKNLPLTEQQRLDPIQLVFMSGLSTRQHSTQISGRGIGMDAVAEQIRQLEGHIRVTSERNKGTEFNIRIPLSQVTRHMIVCKIGNEQFAIDSSYLKQIIPSDEVICERQGEQWIANWQDEWVRIHSVHANLRQQPLSISQGLMPYPLLIIENEHKLYAIAVDALLNSFDLVLKSFGDIVDSIPGYLGLTQTGDGTLVPVLNLAELITQKASVSPIVRSQKTNKIEHPTVLIVDDSLSIRNSLKLLLNDAGFSVDTATDGLDALEKINAHPPAVILLDMEMPRMNGLELTKILRNQETTHDLPIVMITSRSHTKHRQQAKSAGVTDYLTKPFHENEVVDTVRHWVNELLLEESVVS